MIIKKSNKKSLHRKQDESRNMLKSIKHTFTDFINRGKKNKVNGASNNWTALPFAEWKDTAITLHMWTQIVGKIRLTLTPWTNHSWHVTLYVTSRGLTTSPIPHGVCTFDIQFDFINHQLLVDNSDGARRTPE